MRDNGNVLNIRGESYALGEKRQGDLFPARQHFQSRREVVPTTPEIDGIADQ